MERKIKKILKDLDLEISEKNHKFDINKALFESRKVSGLKGEQFSMAYWIKPVQYESSIHLLNIDSTEKEIKKNLFKGIKEQYKSQRYHLSPIVSLDIKYDNEDILYEYNFNPKEVEDFYQNKIKEILKALKL